MAILPGQGYIYEKLVWGITGGITQAFVDGAFSGWALPATGSSRLYTRSIQLTPEMYEHKSELAVLVSYWVDVAETNDIRFHWDTEVRANGEAFSIDVTDHSTINITSGDEDELLTLQFNLDDTYINGSDEWLSIILGRDGDDVIDDYTGNMIVSSAYLIRRNQ